VPVRSVLPATKGSLGRVVTRERTSAPGRKVKREVQNERGEGASLVQIRSLCKNLAQGCQEREEERKRERERERERERGRTPAVGKLTRRL